MLTIHGAVRQALESGAIAFWASDYAEPGYRKDGARDILFADWNAQTRYDRATGTRTVEDDSMPRLAELAGRAGYTTEWSDEWTSCVDCGKAVRTSGDSYSWTASYADYDGDIVCHECVAEDPERYLESLEGDARKGVTLDIDPAEYGYVKVNGESYENGWHSGQNDSPEVVAASFRLSGISRYLFRIDDVGQFDVRFSVYVHQDEVPQLAKTGPPASKLPYDPGTEMGKALRGEHSDHYQMTTRTITPEEFVSGSWVKEGQ